MERQNEAGLSGKVAIVTGSSRGIGKRTALALARRGARLVVTARTVEESAPSPGREPCPAPSARRSGRSSRSAARRSRSPPTCPTRSDLERIVERRRRPLRRRRHPRQQRRRDRRLQLVGAVARDAPGRLAAPLRGQRARPVHPDAAGGAEHGSARRRADTQRHHRQRGSAPPGRGAVARVQRAVLPRGRDRGHPGARRQHGHPGPVVAGLLRQQAGARPDVQRRSRRNWWPRTCSS